MRQRYIAPDIREDIKFANVIGLKSVIFSGSVLIIGLLIQFIFPSWIMKLIVVFGLPSLVLLVVNAEIPKYIRLLAAFTAHKAKYTKFDDLRSIELNRSSGAAVHRVLKGKEKVMFFETSANPWPVCPDNKKENRADGFAALVSSLIARECEVTIFATCSAENTSYLEKRYQALGDLPEGIREIEDARIEHHYEISNSAKSMKYILRVKVDEETSVKEISDIIDQSFIALDGDTVEEYAQWQLMPDLKKSRGKEDYLKMSRDDIEVNQMYIKTFLLKIPNEGMPGMLNVITHGDHSVKKGVNINFALHFAPTKVQFNFMMKMKLNRLQNNINAQQTGKASDEPRYEEIKALQALQHFRKLSHSPSGSNNYADTWLTVTISSNNREDFDISCSRLKDILKHGSFDVNSLEFEQAAALDMAWILGDNARFTSNYKGRVIDRDAISALYPLLGGTISDNDGSYIAHRLEDATIVAKDFTKGSNSQNLIVTGATDAGKSTFIKALIESLLVNGLRGYVYDVDGEYFNMCRQYGGEWIDFTSASGKYVDPTIIETPLMDEIDPSKYDDTTLLKIKEADEARYDDAATVTCGVIGLLSPGFNDDMERQNALEYALTDMWEKAGVVQDKPETWTLSRNGSSNLKNLYFGLKEIAKNPEHQHYEGAKRLCTDLWSYFEGLKKKLFKNAQSSDWIKNANLVVFHVASSTDNQMDQQVGALKIVMITHLVWQQIKRDRIKGERFSFEVYDELQRLIRNKSAWPAIYRSITTGRKFNDQVIMGFNDPSILFEGEGGKGIWDNTRYKAFFSLSPSTIENLSRNADVPDVVKDMWLNLSQYSFIFSENNREYDVMRMTLPQKELEMYKTRGLIKAG